MTHNNQIMFAWDLDNNGSFETPEQNPTFSAAGRDGPSSEPVGLRVCDNRSACTTASGTVKITKAPPVATLTGPPSGASGYARTFTLRANDPAPADQAAGFVYNVQWGDGDTLTVPRSPGNGSGVTVNHTFQSQGTIGGQTADAVRPVGVGHGNVLGAADTDVVLESGQAIATPIRSHVPVAAGRVRPVNGAGDQTLFKDLQS